MSQALKEALLGHLIQQTVDNSLGDSSPNHEAKNTHLADALSVARDQEWHQFELGNEAELHKFKMATEAQKLESGRIKNEHEVFKTELAKQEAMAKRISVPTQDPKPQVNINVPSSGLIPGLNEVLAERIRGLSTTTQEPSGSGASPALATAPDTNPFRAAFDAIAARQEQMKQQGQIPASTLSDADKAHKAILEQLQVQLGKLDETSLEYGPMGQHGQILGGLLDVISGPLDVGTLLFGGKPGPMQKAQLLISAANSVSPLVRAGLQDALGRDRMEQTAEYRLARYGMGNLGGHLSNKDDMQSVDEMAATALDINTLLATDSATTGHFSSDAVSGLGDAFRAYQNAISAAQQIPQVNTPEEIASLEKSLREADATMRQHVQRFLKNGGTTESLHDAVVAAQETINSKYQQPLTYTPGDSREVGFRARQKAVAKNFTDQLTQFAAITIGDIPVHEERVKELKIGIPAAREIREGLTLPEDLKLPRAYKDISDKTQLEAYAFLKHQANTNVTPRFAETLRSLRLQNNGMFRDRWREKLLEEARPSNREAITDAFISIEGEKGGIDFAELFGQSKETRKAHKSHPASVQAIVQKELEAVQAEQDSYGWYKNIGTNLGKDLVEKLNIRLSKYSNKEELIKHASNRFEKWNTYNK